MSKSNASTTKLLLFWLWLLSTVTVSVTFRLWFLPSAYGNTCKSSELEQSIEQFQEVQKLQSAKDTLKQCGEASVIPLIDALSDRNKTIRINAAQVLGAIGAEAHPAIPILLATGQDDGNVVVRHNALQALALIGEDLKSQADSLTGWQIREIKILENLVQKLDQALKDLEKDKTEWQTKTEGLEALRLTRNGLQSKLASLTALPSYRVRVWIQGNPLVWLLLLLLVGGIVIWCLKGLPIRYRERILNLLKPIIIFLPQGLTIYGALEEVLNASDLRVSTKFVRISKFVRRDGSSFSNEQYPKGFRVFMQISHNGLGKKTIALDHMEIKIENYEEYIKIEDSKKEATDYDYRQKGEAKIGAGTYPPREFRLLLSGLEPELACWTIDLEKGKIVKARSKNLLDTGREEQNFRITPEQKESDIETINGRVKAKKPGKYRVKFCFYYNVNGEKRSQETESAEIIYKGD